MLGGLVIWVAFLLLHRLWIGFVIVVPRLCLLWLILFGHILIMLVALGLFLLLVLSLDQAGIPTVHSLGLHQLLVRNLVDLLQLLLVDQLSLPAEFLPLVGR